MLARCAEFSPKLKLNTQHALRPVARYTHLATQKNKKVAVISRTRKKNLTEPVCIFEGKAHSYRDGIFDPKTEKMHVRLFSDERTIIGAFSIAQKGANYYRVIFGFDKNGPKG